MQLRLRLWETPQDKRPGFSDKSICREKRDGGEGLQIKRDTLSNAMCEPSLDPRFKQTDLGVIKKTLMKQLEL